eukprot:scaffold49424_cov30-Cyclotella_meneghiniana.AAC.4
MMMQSLLHTLRTASRRASPQRLAVTVASRSNSKRLFSTSPDYLNYETWHRDNYQHTSAAANNEALLNGQHDGNTNKQQQQSQLEIPRTSVLMELSDNVGALHDVLKY